jgi:hypothetical protein
MLASSFSVSVYAIPHNSEFECSSSIKGFNGTTFNALNLIEDDVCACARFIDFVTLDKSASAACGLLDDDIFSRNDDKDAAAYECLFCLFDSYTTHSSTL